ncbi:MAG: tetratricopeptide repeat protein [Chlamydiales bacterium]|nr:tetratricopeptide repeat protein [Chlamydiales bacterium]
MHSVRAQSQYYPPAPSAPRKPVSSSTKEFEVYTRTFTLKEKGSKTEKNETQRMLDNLTALGQYNTAVKAGKAALKEARSKNEKLDATFTLGHLYKNAKDFEKAIETFRSIPQWEKMPNVVQAIGVCYSENGDHGIALELLEKYWVEDSAMYCAKGRIYVHMRQQALAIDCFNKCRELGDDEAAAFALPRCFEDMGKFDEAIRLYTEAQQYNPAKALENLGRCYGRMKDMKLSEEAFEKLVARCPEPHYFLPFGRMYQDLGHFDLAIKTFKRCKGWQENTKLMIAIGCCYDASGKYGESTTYLKQLIKRNSTNNPVLMSVGRNYEAQEDFTSAEACFKAVKNWQTNVDALLCLARVTQLRLEKQACLTEEHKEVADYFMLIPNWENNKQALVGIIWLYMRAGLNTRVNIYLDKAIKRWPECVDFYNLKATFFSVNNLSGAGIDWALKSLTKFPDDEKLALRLFEFYLKNKDRESVERWKNTYPIQFATKKEFIEKMNTLIKRFGGTNPHVERMDYVTLPPVIRSIFEQVGKEKVVLVGSTVIHLLLKTWKPELTSDIDFATKDDSLGESLVNQGFKAIGFVPGLYRRWRNAETPEIDVMLSRVNIAEESEPSIGINPWLSSDASVRDFTICSLYCDADGKVYDPTGKGIEHVKEKLLETVTNPKFCFLQDPVCILRGLKYELRGFTPTSRVKEAIINWNPTKESIQKYLPHMAAILRKMLKQESGFRKIIESYGLKEKLIQLFKGDEDLVRLIDHTRAPANYRRALVGQVIRPIEPERKKITYTATEFKPSKLHNPS